MLTDEIVGLADVVVPHGHLQGLLGEVCIFNVVTELLQNTQQQRTTVAGSFRLAPPRTQPNARLINSSPGADWICCRFWWL